MRRFSITLSLLLGALFTAAPNRAETYVDVAPERDQAPPGPPEPARLNSAERDAKQLDPAVPASDDPGSARPARPLYRVESQTADSSMASKKATAPQEPSSIWEPSSVMALPDPQPGPAVMVQPVAVDPVLAVEATRERNGMQLQTGIPSSRPTEGVLVAHLQPDPEESADGEFAFQEELSALATGRRPNQVMALFANFGYVDMLDNRFQAGRLQGGWMFDAGLRMQLDTEIPDIEFHLEAGVVYASNEAADSPRLVSGSFYAPFDDHFHRVSDLYSTTLRRISRIDFQPALAMAWYPQRLNVSGDYVRFMFRAGPRIGGFDAEFTPLELTPATIALGAAHVAHGHNPALFRYTSNLKTSGFHYGVFGSVGIECARYNVDLVFATVPEVIVGLNVVFAHEQFEWHGLAGQDSGMTTFAPTLSLSLGY